MKEFLYQTYMAALPIVLTALMGYITFVLEEQKAEQKKEHEEQKQERDSLIASNVILLRLRLIEYHDKYVKEGAIPKYAYENYVEMWDLYHDGFKKNTLSEKMLEDIKSLHLATSGRR